MAIPRPAYRGPSCPLCRAVIAADRLHDGTVTCPSCSRTFEARLFHPPQRSARVLQLAHSGPEGGVSCANHARNAAVANCDRCGLLICTLCQLDVESGKYCPACFERLSQEGAIGTARNRFRDYGSLAAVWGVVGLFAFFIFASIPLAIVAIFYAVKAMRHRENRSSLMSAVVAIVIAVIDVFIGAFYIWAMFGRGLK